MIAIFMKQEAGLPAVRCVRALRSLGAVFPVNQSIIHSHPFTSNVAAAMTRLLCIHKAAKEGDVSGFDHVPAGFVLYIQ